MLHWWASCSITLALCTPVSSQGQLEKPSIDTHAHISAATPLEYTCRDIKKASTPPLEIPVPPGTVVKRKGTGAAQLKHPPGNPAGFHGTAVNQHMLLFQ
jgi:hypothetical protein